MWQPPVRVDLASLEHNASSIDRFGAPDHPPSDCKTTSAQIAIAMASQTNGSPNGAANGTSSRVSKRFSDIPATIDIPVQDQDEEAVEIGLEELVDDPTELCALLETENATRTYWMIVALAYAKQGKMDYGIEMLIRGANVMSNNQRERLSIITCLCWMYLCKSRESPRVAPEGTLASEAKTKEYYLQLATQSLNDASRINPAFPPLFLARGVLILHRASLQTPSKAAGGGADLQKMDQLRNALKAFEEALRVSHGRNMLALMGKARVLYSLGKYADALQAYQEAVTKMPDLVDPDPRVGIGLCLFQLGYLQDAKVAWERSLSINPKSKAANILLGLYYLELSGKHPTNSPDFIRAYRTAMTEYTQKAFKLDKNLPLACATFASYFLSRKQFPNVDALAHKAIQYTDVNAIASDGWYHLARKEHYEGDLERAADYYRRADDARGGAEHGYLPAKLGLAQLSVLKNDLGEAKLRLEKMSQDPKNYEAAALLGTLYAEEVFANQAAAVKEDKSVEAKKAIHYLEHVRSAWKDPSKFVLPDSAILLNLARLYETEDPDKALHCLQQVEQMELDQIPKSEYPSDVQDEAAVRSALRKLLPPQLLNNIGCFYTRDGKHTLATEFFQAALDSCVRISQSDSEIDTDALITTITFNLGRSYEYEGQNDRAVEAYEGLLARHKDYTDARTRLTYMRLRQNHNKESAEGVAKLYQENSTDLEVRALYGWYLCTYNSKKRPSNIAEDPEQRHYKHTLQNHDKHDRYALVAMGNLHLMSAREMRRETDQDRQKRSAAYSRAVEFFDKALQLDAKNAYAAQGIAIALVEDKKDYKNALQIFLKVRETIKDAHIYMNLGHIYAELRQFSKAIESYETALSKEGKENDLIILACLGRTWLNKGRTERTNVDAYKTALEYAEKCLKVAPEQSYCKFNVAFVQIQLAVATNALSETQRTSFQLQEALEGLEAAIKSLDEIAASTTPPPPYPKHDIEQRANMARNTQRKQLERALASQKEYESKNKERLAAALEQRAAELRKREEQKKKEEEEERARQDKIRKEREEIAARDRELAERRALEEKQRMEAEMTTDSETGEKVKRKKKTAAPRRERAEGETARPKKRRGGGGKKSAADHSGAEDEGERRPKKKQRLQRGRENQTKYKSAEIVVDSDDSSEDELERAERALKRREATGTPQSGAASDDEDRSTRGGSRLKAGRNRRARSEEDDDDDAMDVDERGAPESERAGRDVGGETNYDDNDDDEEGGAVSRRQQGRSARGRGRILEESDEEEGGSPAAGNGKADTSMVDVDEDDE